MECVLKREERVGRTASVLMKGVMVKLRNGIMLEENRSEGDTRRGTLCDRSGCQNAGKEIRGKLGYV